jgi:uncharacterized membrane protein YuzA (DUF378 family)
MLKIYGVLMRSLIGLVVIQAMTVIFGTSDVKAISLIVLGMAAATFISAYLSALIKDKRSKKNTDTEAVFEV